jgi:hypothetical protein
MANKLNVAIGADITALKKGFDDAVVMMQQSGQKMSTEVAEAAKDIQKRLDALAKSKPTARVVRQLQTMAMEARAMGPAFADMANQFIREAGRMQDEIGDTRAEIGYFASDTRRLDAAIGGAQAVAAGFGLIEGSMAALGVESEDMQKTMMKLQGTMLVLSSLQEIQNALQAESAVRIGVTKAIQDAYNSTIMMSIRGLTGMKAALLATGVGAAIVGIAMLVEKMRSMREAAEKAAQAQRPLIDVAKNASDNFKEEYKNIGPLIAVVGDLTQKMSTRRDALKQIQEIYPNFLANQKLEKVGAYELKQATANLTTEIIKNAKAKAAYDKIAELSAKKFELELKQTKDLEAAQKKSADLFAAGAGLYARQVEETAKTNAKATKTQIDGIDKQIAAITDLISAEKLSADAVVDSGKKKENETKKVVDYTLDRQAALLAINDGTLEALVKAEDAAFATKVKQLKEQGYTEVEINKLRNAALDKVRTDYNNKKTAAEEKEKRDAEQRAKDLLQLETDIAKATAVTQDQKRALELAETTSHYTKLIEDAKKAGKDTLALVQAQAAAENAIKESFRKTDEQKANESRMRQLQFQADMFAQYSQAVIAFNDAIVGKGDEAARKQAKRAKALSLAQALISTYFSAQLAYQSQFMPVPDPSSPVRGGVAAGAAVAAGLANVSKIATQKFADGGIVYGPTLGLMGEYPGARSNPEVIAPLNKLKDIIGSGGNDGGYIATTHISGRDLAIILQKHNNDYSRG